MAFDKHKFSDRTSQQHGYLVSDTNKNFRRSLKEKYEIYEARILTLSRFFNWDEEKTKKSLSLPDEVRDSANIQRRLEALEAQMNSIIEKSQYTIEEKRKQNPNTVVFQTINKNNREQTIAIPEGHYSHSELLNGLVLRSTNVLDSPFKTKERVEFVVQNYENKRLKEEVEQQKEEKKRLKLIKP